MQDNRHIFRTALSEETHRLGIALTDEQLDALTTHYELIVKWNDRVRLVGTAEPKRAAIELFADSLMVNKFICASAEIFSKTDSSPRVADIGAGAGLPGIPLKILRPEWELVVIESSVKTISFLKALIRELCLEGVDALRGRAEALAHDEHCRETFDLALCRAVASPELACEIAIPFLKIGGSFIAQTTEEHGLEGIGHAVEVLGATTCETRTYMLTGLQAARLLVRIEKLKPTASIYPRDIRVAKRKPLG